MKKSCIDGDTHVNGALSNSDRFSFNNKLYDAETIFKKMDIPADSTGTLVFNGLKVNGFILDNDTNDVYASAEYNIKNAGTKTHINNALYRYDRDHNRLELVHAVSNVAIYQWVLLKNSADADPVRNKFWLAIGVHCGSDTAKCGHLSYTLYRYGDMNMASNYISYTHSSTTTSPFNYIVTGINVRFKESLQTNSKAMFYSFLYSYAYGSGEKTALALICIGVDKLFYANAPFSNTDSHVKLASLIITDVPHSTATPFSRINRSTYIHGNTMYIIRHVYKPYINTNFFNDTSAVWLDDKPTTDPTGGTGKRLRTYTTWDGFMGGTSVSNASGDSFTKDDFLYSPTFIRIRGDYDQPTVEVDTYTSFNYIIQNTYTTRDGKGIGVTLFSDTNGYVYLSFRMNTDESIPLVDVDDPTRIIRVCSNGPLGENGVLNDAVKCVLYTMRDTNDDGSGEAFYIYILVNRRIYTYRVHVNNLYTTDDETGKTKWCADMEIERELSTPYANGEQTIGDTDDAYQDYVNHDLLTGVVTHYFRTVMYKYDIVAKTLTTTPFKIPSDITDLTKMNFGYDMMTYSDAVYVLTRGIVVTEDIQSDQLMNMINRMHYMTTTLVALSDRVAALESQLESMQTANE